MSRAAPSPSPLVVTGAAGFIGSHLCARLLGLGATVVGLDAFTSSTGVGIKRRRIDALCTGQPGWELVECDVTAPMAVDAVLARVRPAAVVHLAAQPGIARSFSHPQQTAHHNLVGFQRVAEACAHSPHVAHFVYASSSSVYGAHGNGPSTEGATPPAPLNLYAATKLSNEWMAGTLARTHGLRSTGVRLFTVYGPWGRPDMAPTRFARALMAGQPLTIRGDGRMRRDFTFIDDAVDALVHLTASAPQPDDPLASIVNVGGGRPETVRTMAQSLARHLDRPLHWQARPAEAGEALATWACTRELDRREAPLPQTSLDEGIRSFAEWFLSDDTRDAIG